jgi:hypothetical protein
MAVGSRPLDLVMNTKRVGALPPETNGAGLLANRWRGHMVVPTVLAMPAKRPVLRMSLLVVMMQFCWC